MISPPVLPLIFLILAGRDLFGSGDGLDLLVADEEYWDLGELEAAGDTL